MPQISNLSFNVSFEPHNPNRVGLTNTTPSPPAGFVGIFKVTQPDGYVRNGDINTPDVTNVVSSCVVTLVPDSAGQLQQGQYIIEFIGNAPGYLSTSFIRTFTLQYTAATISLRNDFDVFTPQLAYTDISNYSVSGWTISSGPTRKWDATSPTTGTISGTNSSIDIRYNNKYYAENYTIRFEVNVAYASQAYPWLTITHTRTQTTSVTACIPKSLEDLTQAVEALREESNASCGGDWAKFEKANALYAHLLNMLRLVLIAGQQQSGFFDVYQQLLTYIQNGSVACTTIGQVIPPYDFSDYESSIYDGQSSYCQLVGDGVNTTYRVNHQLGDTCVVVQVYEVATGKQVFCDLAVSTINSIDITFYEPPTLNQYRVVAVAGAIGLRGQGFQPGGLTGQILRKKTNADFDTEWADVTVALPLLVPYTGATQSVYLGEHGVEAGFVRFDTTPTTTPATAAVMSWNDTDGTAELRLKGNNVTLQVGQEMVARVVNKTGANLLGSQYKAVRVRKVSEGGAQGQRLAVVLAQANTEFLSTDMLGIVTENISNNQEGFITTFGAVKNIDTTGALQGEVWADGDILFLSPTVAGGLTKVKPSAPDHLSIVGYVEYAHQNNGKIFVHVQTSWELDELHNVSITNPVNNQVLKYNGTLWVNSTIPAVTSVGLATATSGVTITDTPVTSSGVININIATAAAGQSGLLSASDWATFNAKQSAITLTTTGNSGAATFVGSTLNIPNYTLAGLGGVPSTRSLTINGTAYDMSADRVWSVGTVTSVAALTIGTAGTDITSTVATGTTTPVITLNIPTASASNRGALSAADWVAFNAKVSGSGTTNYVPKFTAASTIGNSQIFDNGQSVSINTTAPAYSQLNRGNLTINGDDAILAFKVFNTNAGYLYHNATSLLLNNAINGPLLLYTNDTERLRIFANGRVGVNTTTDAGYQFDINGTLRSVNGANFATTSGNVGIGTASPAVKFDVTASGGDIAAFRRTDAGNALVQYTNANTTDDIIHRFRLNAGAGNFYDMRYYGTGGYFGLQYNGNNGLHLTTSSKVLINTTSDAGDYKLQVSGNIYNTGSAVFAATSGNVGVGVTPSAWGSTAAAIQIRNSVLWNYNNGANFLIGSNNYFDVSNSTYKYIITGFATEYSQDQGKHIWKIAASGTAGNTVTFTPSMTLNDASELLINTTTDAGDYKLQVAGNIYNTGSAVLAATSGNVGIGVVPSAWSVVTATQIKQGAVSADQASNIFNVSNNLFYDGSVNKYIQNGSAAFYQLFQNQHIFYNAPSGTAGGTITFAERMRIDASGNVGIGTASPSQKLDVNGISNFRGDIYVGVPSTTTGRAYYFNATNTGRGEIYYDGPNNVFRIESNYGGTGSYQPLTFWTSANERMRIHANGRVGINTGATDAGYQLDVNGSIRGQSDAVFATGSGNVFVGATTAAISNGLKYIYNEAGNASGIGPELILHNTSAADAASMAVSFTGVRSGAGVASQIRSTRRGILTFHTQDLPSATPNTPTERMRIDALGNVGIGITPSAWGLGKGLEIGSAGNSLWSYGVDNIFLASNAYFNGGWKYGGSGKASSYTQFQGQHFWDVTGSGTAGNAITFTTAMTLDNAGRLGIGTTSPTERLVVTNVNRDPTSAEFTANIVSNSPFAANFGGSIGFTGATDVAGTTLVSFGAIQGVKSNSTAGNTAGDMRILTRNSGGPITEKMRVTTDGNVGIGTTTPTAGKVQIANLTSAALNNGLILTAADLPGANNGQRIGLTWGVNTTVRASIGMVFENLLNNSNAYMTFGTGSDNTERMRIFSNGRIFMGASPTDAGYQLDVNGGTRVTGRITVTGNDTLGLSITRAGTSAISSEIYNGGGDNGWLLWGVESSAGGVIFPGTTAYASVFGSFRNVPIQFATNNTVRMTIDGGGSVGIGVASPSASAILQVDSTTKGMLPPRMTTTQRDAITSPATGLIVYDTTVNKLSVYNGTTWKYAQYE